MIESYRGKPSLLKNLASEESDSIHDEETAKKMGFKGAFVPGSIVASYAFPTILDHFGTDWFAGGWYRFKFISPVYTTTHVISSGELIDNVLQLNVASEESRLCCSAEAGLGYQRPWETSPVNTDKGQGLFSTTPIGTALGEWTFKLDRTAGKTIVQAAADNSVWFNEPINNEQIAPPEMLMELALEQVHKHEFDLSGTRGPGMWTQHELTIKKPLFFNRDYVMKEWVADFGVKGKKPFIEFEFSVSDRGELIARGRHQSKWLPAKS